MNPIIACSSGSSSNNAISIIRVSGFNDINEFNSCFNLKENISPRKMYFSKLKKFSGEVMDEVMFCYFASPNSYTGENLLELYVHGNKINVQRIISYFVSSFKFSHAKPGEFTLRALKNKKLTLSQVEGLDVLLNANSSYALNHGLELLNGDLNEKYNELSRNFLNLKSSLEMMIDFLEDIGEEEGIRNFNKCVCELESKVEYLVSRVKSDSSSILNPKIVLIGEPNAGKSTFFNNFINDTRAIVTPIEGTTRDYLRETVCINEHFFELVDTAGLRKSKDIVEREGIKRSKEQFDTAFFKIALVNPTKFTKENYKEINQVDLIIFSHGDKARVDEVNEILSSISFKYSSYFIVGPNMIYGPMGPGEKIGPMEPGEKIGPMGPGEKIGPMGPDEKIGPMGPDEKNGPMGPEEHNFPVIRYSTTDSIKQIIFNKYERIVADQPILLDRHKYLIESIYSAMHNFVKISKSTNDVAILSSELIVLEQLVEDLIGVTSPDEVLNNIFDNFCIGK